MRISLISVTLLAASLSTPATAAVVVDSGTPVGVTHVILNNLQSLGARFSIAEQTTLTSVEGFIWNRVNQSDFVGLAIYTDPLPVSGTLLFSAGFFADPGERWNGVSGLNWNLTAGDYWVAFFTDGGMSMRNGAPAPLSAYASSGGGWAVRPASFGVRISGEPALAVVPEPSTWALLMLGFGILGGAMRRRQRVSVAYT